MSPRLARRHAKSFAQVHRKFVIHLAEPIWIRDRLEAFAVAALWRNKLSYVRGLFFDGGLRQVEVALETDVA